MLFDKFTQKTRMWADFLLQTKLQIFIRECGREKIEIDTQCVIKAFNNKISGEFYFQLKSDIQINFFRNTDTHFLRNIL